MNTLYASSPDGTQIAYDRSGRGPALVLLHGGGTSRQDWHEGDYVSRLRDEFSVIPIDLRGHGESGKPTEPADYTIEKMVQDVLAVADACGFERFHLWAMSYGGKISRYVGARSERVDRLVVMSTQFGLGVSGRLRQAAIDFCEHWPPIVQAQQEDRLDLGSLSEADRDLLQRLNVPVMLGWVRAMLDSPVVLPSDFRCPTLWLVGSQDPDAIDSIEQHQQAIPGSQVQIQIVEGLDHNQIFDEIDMVFHSMLAFTKA